MVHYTTVLNKVLVLLIMTVVVWNMLSLNTMFCCYKYTDIDWEVYICWLVAFSPTQLQFHIRLTDQNKTSTCVSASVSYWLDDYVISK